MTSTRARILMLEDDPLLTNSLEKGLIDEAFDLRAFYVCKPAPEKSFRLFVESLAARDRANEAFGLLSASAMRELDVIAAALRGMSPADFIGAQAITINTDKTRVRNILKKTGAKFVGEIRDRVLRDVSLSIEMTIPTGDERAMSLFSRHSNVSCARSRAERSRHAATILHEPRQSQRPGSASHGVGHLPSTSQSLGPGTPLPPGDEPGWLPGGEPAAHTTFTVV